MSMCEKSDLDYLDEIARNTERIAKGLEELIQELRPQAQFIDDWTCHRCKTRHRLTASGPSLANIRLTECGSCGARR